MIPSEAKAKTPGPWCQMLMSVLIRSVLKVVQICPGLTGVSMPDYLKWWCVHHQTFYLQSMPFLQYLFVPCFFLFSFCFRKRLLLFFKPSCQYSLHFGHIQCELLWLHFNNSLIWYHQQGPVLTAVLKTWCSNPLHCGTKTKRKLGLNPPKKHYTSLLPTIQNLTLSV